MTRTITDFVLAVCWFCGLILAGSDGAGFPLINGIGVFLIGMASVLACNDHMVNHFFQRIRLSTRRFKKPVVMP